MIIQAKQILAFTIGYTAIDSLFEGIAKGEKKTFHHVIATSCGTILAGYGRQLLPSAFLWGTGFGIATVPIYYLIYTKLKSPSVVQLLRNHIPDLNSTITTTNTNNNSSSDSSDSNTENTNTNEVVVITPVIPTTTTVNNSNTTTTTTSAKLE